ncbi:M4 family metallopeptidase [Streptomyces sp. NPDC059832]|uniref:M4 family metallopeptidase n=1 Tax=Streptomyces sp. NPDC059832 TaxID=3346966 RepID=UPI0036666585
MVSRHVGGVELRTSRRGSRGSTAARGSGAPRGSGIPRGAALAALLGSAALVVTALPAQAVTPSAAAPRSEVVPGDGTATPALVDAISERVDAGAKPADAARSHLADRKSRYRIADPQRDLTPVQSLTSGSEETVRFQQKHHGVEVLGGQYVVRMEKKAGKRVVTGTSGKYFTGLTTGTEAKVDAELAVRRAVATTASRLGGNTLTEADAVRAKGKKSARAAALTGTARGLVVIPKGAGVLAQHVTVRGTDPATGEPVLQEVYIDAAAGFPVLQYSGIKTLTAPDATSAAGTPAKAAAAKAAPAAGAGDDFPGVKGTGLRVDGSKVPLDLYYDSGNDKYLMEDYSRQWDTSKGVLATWDAQGVDVGEASGRWPSGISVFSHPTSDFGKEAGQSGATDAHWAAGQVYDYYRKHHGRDSLDGRGMNINSLVGVTLNGRPYVNAFWDGQKMVYGSGDSEYKPLSADLDVVGHEMTHGVVESTANLVYAGQSGAMNEAIADYFGNAIDVTASGTAMDDPDAGLIGEDLCRTTAPRACAFRDLNDGATTSKNHLGVAFSTDNGGVHLNSTIYSGALWDIREDLGAELADKIAYRALDSYLTPLDGFTEGRNATIAAARELGVTAKQLAVVKRSFDAHGIVPGWEKALGVDSDKLFGKLNIAGTGVGAGGGWWATSKSNDDGSEPYSVYAGRTDGKGAPKLISPNDGRYHVYPATDGKTVVWAAFGDTGVDILSRPIAGGPVKTVWTSFTGVEGLRVDGDLVVFTEYDPFGSQHVGYVNTRTGKQAYVDGGKYYLSTAVGSVKGSTIAYGKLYPGENEYELGVEVLDVTTGKTKLLPQSGTPQALGQTAVTKDSVVWLVDEVADRGQFAVRRSNPDGTGLKDISPETGDGALFAYDLTASDDAVTVTAQTPDTVYRNETLPKLWQLTPDGSRVQRVSCNRGEQSSAAADGGRRVVWIDGTTGWTDLVTRERPAGNCG